MKCDSCKSELLRPFSYEKSSMRVQCPECGSFTESQKYLKYMVWLIAILGFTILGYAHLKSSGSLYGFAALLLGAAVQLIYSRWTGDPLYGPHTPKKDAT